MINIEEKLKQLFPEGQWKINKSSAGESAKAYIADNGHKKVFIKFGVKALTLIRLAELGVAPKVIYDGTKEDKPHVIQEFIDGKYPEDNWFPNNLEIFAKFIQKYQQDKVLKDILVEGKTQSYQEHIDQVVAYLDNEIKDTQSNLFESNQVKAGIKVLKEKGKELKPVPLVPTHADPNIKNFLLIDKGLIMIDWDDIILSDPMKDIGLMLWWYVPKSSWPDFFKFYGQNLDEERIFWWIARGSLSIASWFTKRGDMVNGKFFIDEFLFALQRRNNSQMYLYYNIN